MHKPLNLTQELSYKVSDQNQINKSLASRMGCADSKPQSHTKRPALKPEPHFSNNSNLINSGQNPELKNEKNQVKIPNSQPITIVTLNQNNISGQNPKSNLQVLQNNPSLTRQEVIEPVRSQQKEFKKVQVQSLKPIKQDPKIQKESQLAKKEVKLNSEQKEAQTIREPKKYKQDQGMNKKEQYNNSLSLNVQEVKQDPIRLSGTSIFPDMHEEQLLVSNITKQNLSAEKIHNQSIQRIENQQSPLKTDNQMIKRHQEITAQEIKINVLEGNENVPNSTLDSQEFAVLAQYQFDLNCSFDPNALVIDINKVAW